jgi:hypothetical protein
VSIESCLTTFVLIEKVSVKLTNKFSALNLGYNSPSFLQEKNAVKKITESIKAFRLV